MMSIIKVNHLIKKYGNRTILNNVNLSVNKGEFVAIVGPSGSGKSTLLNILGMLDTPTSGEIELLGKKLPGINSKEATLIRRTKINYLFQTFALISNESVKSNLLLAMKFKDISKAKKNDAINDVLTKLGISELKDATVNTLSGGEQQRVALARTILKPGDIILADEPTGALDPKRAREAFKQISHLRSEHEKTIIMVTHNMEEADETDRIINISDFK